MLVPVEHATRIDVPRACRLARALGASWVRADGYRPRADQIDRLLAALVPDREETTVSFDGGLALDELEPVAFGGSAYTDISTRSSPDPEPSANLRVWPDRAWLHVSPLPAGGLVEAAAIVREHLGIDVPAEAGVNVRGETQVGFATPHIAIDIKSPDRAAVFRMFRASALPRTARGFVMRPSAATLAAFPTYLRALAGPVSIDAELPPETAMGLHDVSCDGWVFDDVTFDPASGLLSTERLAPVSDAQVDEWTAKIDAALERT